MFGASVACHRRDGAAGAGRRPQTAGGFQAHPRLSCGLPRPSSPAVDEHRRDEHDDAGDEYVRGWTAMTSAPDLRDFAGELYEWR